MKIKNIYDESLEILIVMKYIKIERKRKRK